jgi:hypothetical protein
MVGISQEHGGFSPTLAPERFRNQCSNRPNFVSVGRRGRYGTRETKCTCRKHSPVARLMSYTWVSLSGRNGVP